MLECSGLPGAEIPREGWACQALRRLQELTAANTWKAFRLFPETVTLSQVNLFCLLKEKVSELETRLFFLGP